ncbi:MAG: AraC family transcriptional regulator [Myxococcaceae bacterium]|nr:MAG: AraC family transcriptional regulator [Myxococcaceae bacterium]
MSTQPNELSEQPGAAIRAGLRCLQLDGAIFLRAEFTAPWAYETPSCEQVMRLMKARGQRVVLFHIFTEGSCRIRLERGGTIEDFSAGDIVIFPSGDQHTVGYPSVDGAVPIQQLWPPQPWGLMPLMTHGGGGARTAMVCGYLLSDDAPFNPVLESLPPMIKVRPSGGPLARWVEASVDYALHATDRRAGDDPLLRRLPELLVTECLCDFAARRPPEETGWLAALSDPTVGRALGLMHRQPAHPWALQELARRAATSRSVLDERFRTLLGRAPMAYLTAWRLQLAARELRTTTASLAEVAGAVGYASEASFSKAFKRHVGVSPGEWRSR